MLLVGVRNPRPETEWQRASIAEVYFERRGSLVPPIPLPLARKRAYELTLPPPTWPF